MNEIPTTANQEGLQFPAPCNVGLEKASTYTVKGKTFVVEPIFQKTGNETLVTVLLKLMQSEPTAN